MNERTSQEAQKTTWNMNPWRACGEQMGVFVRHARQKTSAGAQSGETVTLKASEQSLCYTAKKERKCSADPSPENNPPPPTHTHTHHYRISKRAAAIGMRIGS